MTTHLRSLTADARRPDAGGPVDRPYARLDAADRARPILTLLQRWIEATPGRTALVAPDGVLTYRELAGRRAAMAAHIAATLGGRRGPVALLAPQGLDHVVVPLACLQAGVPFVPLDPAHGFLRNRQIVLATGVAALLHGDGLADDAAAIGAGAGIAGLDRASPGSPDVAPPAAQSQAAYIVVTSGSTGRPKGIVMREDTMVACVATPIDVHHFNADDVVAFVGGTTGAPPLIAALGALLAGGTAVIEPPGATPLRALAERGGPLPTHLVANASVLRLMARDATARRNLAQLRSLRTTGDIVTWDDIEALRRVVPAGTGIYCYYASSESLLTTGWFVGARPEGGELRVPIGHPVEGLELWLGEDAEATADGSVSGELFVAGDRVVDGYWQEPELSAARFLPHPHRPDRRIFRTGDIVRVRPDGLFEFVGRADNQVKLNGWRIEIEEIEAAACQAPGVAGAAVAPRRDAGGTVVALALHVEPGEDTGLEPETVAEHLAGVLPRHMQPAEIHLAGRLPLTPTGKIDRVRMAEHDAKVHDAQRAPAAPDDSEPWPDPLERRIAAAIARELRLAALPPDDSFTRLGGNSLSAIGIALGLEKTFGVTIDPEELFDNAPIRTLVAKVAELAADPS